MPFPRQLLNQDEGVLLDVHPHWLFYIEPALALLGAIVVAIVLAAITSNSGVRIVGVVLVVITAIWFAWRAATWRTTHFVITSDRVIYRSGVFAKRGVQIPIERVNNVNFHQGVFERIVGAGDLLIESAGSDGQQRFTDVRHPDRIQNMIHSAMDEDERKRAGYVGGSPGNDVATQLEKLEGMLQRGTLSRQEFEAEKHRLLGGSASPNTGSPLPPPPPGAGR